MGAGELVGGECRPVLEIEGVFEGGDSGLGVIDLRGGGSEFAP